MYSLKLGPKSTIVVLTSPQIINDLLDKNSALTSDRPQIHFADRVTKGLNLTLSHYTETWKSLRRGAHELLTPQACRQHLAIQQAEATQLSYDLLANPEDFASSIRRYAISVMFSVLYGKRVPRFSSTSATEFYEMMEKWVNLLAPGAHPPVDMIPVLKFVPEGWARWKRICNEVRRLQKKLYFGLMGEVEGRMQADQENGCFLETIIKRQDEWGLNREMISYLGGVMIEGGADTTSAFLQSLLLLLTAHPEVQQKAKRELDEVVGNERMPILDDIERLPYIQAIILEASDNYYHSHTSISANYSAEFPPHSDGRYSWGVYNDPEIFTEPEKYNPDRFLGERGPELIKVMNLAFGSGRRSCPGIHLARNAVNINTMNLLWGFHFGKPLDSNGKEMEVDTFNYAVGVSYCPNPFKSNIKPRTPHHAELIKLQLNSFNDAFSQFEYLLDDVDKAHVKELRKKLEE
ncbi:cytochrome P450 [Dendrothele bispora CBS 962.96]|uniref:Cytochrome P450 n=1 Tax=Dendrothele bispora (strain CBS 962.96) TaxID=1314807 RepID=A0A4S8MAH9_DENBC|nr:cytochrome P450 [Dendrothele bispora CBS 962.96]